MYWEYSNEIVNQNEIVSTGFQRMDDGDFTDFKWTPIYKIYVSGCPFRFYIQANALFVYLK